LTGVDTAVSWSNDIFGVIKDAGLEHVCFVPDAGHQNLIEHCIADNQMTTVSLTSEEEGVAMLAGSWLGGKKGLLLMQSSGVGNCINMLSINQECRIPILMLVTMRGEWGEFNPWQTTMGQGSRAALEAVGVIVHRLDEAADAAETVRAAARQAFLSYRSVAVLIGQRLIGFKEFSK
jgi:sulfopyruvate decarboxylase alpha subunit